jgi:hypothetical protein
MILHIVNVKIKRLRASSGRACFARWPRFIAPQTPAANPGLHRKLSCSSLDRPGWRRSDQAGLTARLRIKNMAPFIKRRAKRAGETPGVGMSRVRIADIIKHHAAQERVPWCLGEHNKTSEHQDFPSTWSRRACASDAQDRRNPSAPNPRTCRLPSPRAPRRVRRSPAYRPR